MSARNLQNKYLHPVARPVASGGGIQAMDQHPNRPATVAQPMGGVRTGNATKSQVAAGKRLMGAPAATAGAVGNAAAYAAPPPMAAYPTTSPSLAESPAYLAFMRELGLEEANVKGSTQDRIDAINRELARQLPDIAQAGEYTREGITGNFLSRGLLRSSDHERAIARQRAAQALQQSHLEGATADQVLLMQRDLERRLADVARRRAEGTLSSASSTYA